MPYITAAHRYVDTVDLTLAASAARTATGNGTAADPQDATTSYFKLDVTVASGTTPTLNVTIQGQDAAGAWFTLGTFTQATGVTAQTIAVPVAGRNIRASWTIAGTTPSFTFSVAGEAR